MAENGFSVVTEDVTDLAPIKTRYQVPPEIQSCHTAIVDGYIIEGHVPAREINRLLSERPAISGLAVPGMPMGSPGMEAEDFAAELFDVIAFDSTGKTEVYASYRP